MNFSAVEQFKQRLRELSSAGRASEVQEVLEQAVASNQADEEILNALAVRYQGAGRLDESIELFNKALALNPGYAIAAFNLGNSWQIGGRFDDAIAAYGRAIELDPNLPEAHVAFGSALLACGRTLESIEACREAVRIRPGFADGVFNLANALMANNQIEEACTSLHQLIEANRDLIPRLQLMGDQHLQVRRLSSATAIYRLALALNPDDDHSVLGLSLSFGYNNDLEGALQIVDQGLVARPAWIAGYWLKIHILEALGRDAYAVESRDILLNILSETDRCFNRKPVLPKILQITNLPRIGHLTCEVDSFLRSKIRTEGNLRTKELIVLYEGLPIANTAFLPLVESYFAIVELPRLLEILRLPRCFEVIDCNAYVTHIGGRADLYELHGSLPPDQVRLYSLPESYRRARQAMFEAAGIPAGARYICLHVREGGYSPADERFHTARNASIANFMAAVDKLASLGIYTIRMGDPTMTPAPQHPYLFDYALSPLTADEIDFALVADAYFFLGTSSGAMTMGSLFGTPIVCTNMALPFNFSPTGAPNQVGIPKLLRFKGSNELVPWATLYRTRDSEIRHSFDMDKLYVFQENSPEEIQDVVEEMYHRLSGIWKIAKEDEELQERARAFITLDSMTYGTASRCGTAFLRRYAHLLEA
jgi:putative glycosyltransferase (TIGR04372 family)